jgi:hypothetical protein
MIADMPDERPGARLVPLVEQPCRRSFEGDCAMGGCCFTPRKTQLLWWYWLLLFSIVGIPMFAAALYVRHAARHGLIEPCQVRLASRIFWGGACVSLLLVSLVLLLLVFGTTQLPGAGFWDVVLFAASFLFWLTVAIGAARLTEKSKPWYARMAVVAFCAIVPAVAIWWSWGLMAYYMEGIGMLPLSAMRFLVCMLPAHYWYRFTVSPSTKRAWLFVAALALGTALFWVVSQYGYSAHAGLHQWWVTTGSHGLWTVRHAVQ